MKKGWNRQIIEQKEVLDQRSCGKKSQGVANPNIAKGGTLSRCRYKTSKLLDKICKIRDSQGRLAGAKEIQSKSANLGKNLLNCFSDLWLFLYEEGMEPTNNRAERGLRPAVMWKKITGGSQSDWGLRFTQRLLTLSFRLKQRSGSSFNFLTRTFEPRLRGDLAPSILDSS